MKEYYSIGQVAKLKGVSVKALRFYDKIGLVKPAYVDPETDYRYYSLEQLLLIESIALFKASGASLKDIAQACKDNNCVSMANFFFNQIIEAKDKIAHLQEAIHKYEQMASRIYYDKSRSVNQDVYYRPMRARTVLARACTTPPTDRATYEIYFDVYTTIREAFLSSIYATGSVVSVDPNTLAFSYEQIFVEVERTEDSLPVPLQTLPAGEYLCVNYYEENREEQLQKLFQVIRQEDYQPKLMVEADTLLAVTLYEHPLMEFQVLLS